MSETHDKEPAANFDGISERHGQRPPTYFMVLFLGLIVWGVIFMAYYLLGGWSSQGEFEEKMAAHRQRTATAGAAAAPVAPPVKAAAVDAGALFAQHCAVCHGAAGKGGIGPDLSAASYKYGRTPTDVTTSLHDGRSGGMPPFAAQLSQTELAALVDYVLSLK